MNISFTREGLYLDNSAKDSLCKRNASLWKYVFCVSFKYFVVFNSNFQQQITWLARSLSHLIPLSLTSKNEASVNARWYCDRLVNFRAHRAHTRAGEASGHWSSHTFAVFAFHFNIRDAIYLLNDVACAIADLTFDLCGSRLSSCTLACITVFISSKADFFCAPKGWLFKSDSDSLLNVSPFDYAFCIFRLSWLVFCLCHVEELFEFFEDVFKTLCFLLFSTTTKSLERKSKWVEAEAFAMRISVLLIVAWHTSRIIYLSFLCLSQCLISFVDLGKNFGCVRRLIDIRMVLLCLQQKCFFYFFLTRSRSHSKYIYMMNSRISKLHYSFQTIDLPYMSSSSCFLLALKELLNCRYGCILYIQALYLNTEACLSWTQKNLQLLKKQRGVVFCRRVFATNTPFRCCLQDNNITIWFKKII